MSNINLEHGTSMLDPYAAEDRLQPVSCTSLSEVCDRTYLVNDEKQTDHITSSTAVEELLS
jgi:hypothetical protein